MENFFETVVRLEASNNLSELLAFVNEQHDPGEISVAVWNLLSQRRLRPAYILAMMLANAGTQDPAIAMALSAGGFIYNAPQEERRGLESLQAQTNTLPDEWRKTIHKHLLAPVIPHLLDSALKKPNNNNEILRILEILKAAEPRFRTTFDWDATVPRLSRAEMRQRGHEQARLVTYTLPPPGMHQQRRVLVTGRETFFLMPNSRTMDIGLRMVTAMNTYGWHASFYGMQKSDSISDCHAIIEICRQQKIEILLLDEELLLEIKQARQEMLQQLRSEHPSLKVVGYFLDAWLQKPASLLESTNQLDLVWDMTSPSLSIWNNPALANKMLYIPHPLAGNFGTPTQPLTPQMLFAGSVQLFNWHRAFWLAAADRQQLPIKRKTSTHVPDGLPPLESYALYMQNLATATCCLNLSMRPDADYTCIVTGRSFEAICSGSLLVQESSPNMHYYFIPGEHYLEFSTIAELSAVVQFITEHREEAEEIRRCGNAFALERYNDKTIIGYMDKMLYFPD